MPSEECGDDTPEPVMLLSFQGAKEVLPENRIPDLDPDEALVLQSDPKKPFRALVPGEKFEEILTLLEENAN